MELPPKRSADEMVAEILDASRAAAKSGQAVEEQVAQIKKILDRAPFGDYGMSTLTAWNRRPTARKSHALRNSLE
jgi:hypothetical protein